MKRIKLILRRMVKPLLLLALLIGGAVFGLYKMRVDLPGLNTPKIYAHIDSMVVRAEQMKGRAVGLYEKYFHKKEEEEVHHEQHKIVVTSPLVQDIKITQQYVCQIHSRTHTDICALEDGYLLPIQIKEGQAVKEKQVLFELNPVLYKARWDAKVAERNLAQLELANTERLHARDAVSLNEVLLFKAKLAMRQAEADQAEAEYDFTKIKAPFDGIVDRLKQMQGSLVKEGDVLTTLYDNSVMWVYFNVTEKRYLEYMRETGPNKVKLDVRLMLANRDDFAHPGKIDQENRIGAIEGQFNNQTGNLAFRADFPNPDRLLRHGQTGTVFIDQALKDAILIPQRATFENLAKRYVFVVDKDDVVHQREIVITHELEDIFVVEKKHEDVGLDVSDKIILEGIRQVRDGEKVEFVILSPVDAMKDLKNIAQ
jgi:membrane fusion protein, multidrug efflux system